jgi:hypothetical protein
VILVAVLTAIGAGQVIAWCLYWWFRRDTSFAVLMGRASARKIAIGTARSNRPLSEHVADFQREFERNISEQDQ